MNPTQYYVNVLKNYTKFDGRARRAEYWYFVLFNAIVSVALLIVGNVIKFPLLQSLYALAVFLPTIAVGIRRMHDHDKSGWFIIVPFYKSVLSLHRRHARTELARSGSKSLVTVWVLSCASRTAGRATRFRSLQVVLDECSTGRGPCRLPFVLRAYLVSTVESTLTIVVP
jgi:uncharacterized membrane protein YhaH (DUF805 family)